jgi:DNA transformation protein
VAFDADFGAFIEELFADLGRISIRRMFGGAGVYLDDTIFGIADDGLIYLKVDDETRPRFEAAGSRPFTYPKGDEVVVMNGYWMLPDEALDDPEAASAWARLGLEAAARKRRSPRKR